MIEYLEVDGKKFTYAINFKENDYIRSSFNILTKNTYGFDFEQWYQDGYWNEKYKPYILLDGDKVVANVSVNLMDFIVDGIEKRYIQIGTVMTDFAYRGLGLSRALMEKVLSDWSDKCELIYLFANDSVLDFYTKFGFDLAEEYQYSKSIINKVNTLTVNKLDVSDTYARNLFFSIVSNTVRFSKISLRNNAYLVMFYCTSFMKNNLYYIKDYNVVVVADFVNDTLYLQDVFCTKKISLDRVIDALINEQTTKVVLGFTPEDESTYEMNQLKEENTTLFVKAIKEDIFSKGMFPVLSHS